MPNRNWWPWALTLGFLGALYGPVVRWGPVAEDLQWAYKGWIAAHNPVAFLEPFHQHYRPLVLAFFSFASSVFADHWWLYRLSSLAFGVATLWVAGKFLKTHGNLPAGVSAVFVALWLASPLTDEVFFVTCEVQQILCCLGILLALWARRAGSVSRWMWVGALVALGSKEEAIVLPLLAVVQDAVLFHLGSREVWRRTRPLWGLVLAYLLLYRLTAHFQASWFYQNPWLAFPNFLTTWTAFWHLSPPVLTGYSQALASHWPKAVLALMLTGFSVVLAPAARRYVVFSFLSAIVALAPTLPANVQSPRYTFLAYFFFLAGVAVALREMTLRAGRWRVAALAVLALVVISVGANDVLVVVGDRADWRQFQQLSTRLDHELEPVLSCLREGKDVLLLRSNDHEPLWRLIRSPQGMPKLYFPRPDDPYGVVAVSALASWRLRREGIAVRRVLEAVGYRTPVAFAHEVGRFVPVPPPAVDDRRLFGFGMVFLEPVRAVEFNPQAFP